MSKKFKSQASSARAASAFTGSTASFQTTTSLLAYVTEAPDLSQISQPDVVVVFKNLGKRDSTTKAKALEDLQDVFQRSNSEHAILVAWCDIYPRISIDNSRRVRQLAHSLLGALVASSGKRAAPLLPKVIGCWLAGVFDSDKVVAKSAQDALQKAFPTNEKQRAIWKIYRNAIAEYVEDATTIQTKATLSDERVTSSDDAEAKYVRVVGSAMNVLARYLEQGMQTEIGSTNVLDMKSVWEFVHYSDPYLRRNVCGLAIAATKYALDQLDWQVIATCFLSKGLSASQIGSASQFTEALLSLTNVRPEIWTTDYRSKTPISKRLHQFLKKGSQHGSNRVWSSIGALIKTIPVEVWLIDDKSRSAAALAEAIQTGVRQQSERLNAVAAWNAYIDICIWMSGLLGEDRFVLVNEHVAPIVPHYVCQQGNQYWQIPVDATQICVKVLVELVAHGYVVSFDRAWMDAVTSLTDAMKMSLPESSKEFRSSQDSVIAQASRLFNVQEKLPVSLLDVADIRLIIRSAETRLLHAAIELLTTRNGKPYAAASVLETLVQKSADLKQDTILQDFVRKDLPKFINGPSAEYLAFLALTCRSIGVIDDMLLQGSPTDINALCYILQRSSAADIPDRLRNQLKTFIVDLNDPTSARLAKSVIQNDALKELQIYVFDLLQDSLSPSVTLDAQQGALNLIEGLISAQSTQWLFTAGYLESLLSKILLLSDSDSGAADHASQIGSKIRLRFGQGVNSKPIIQQQLNGEGAGLTIFTLIDLAEKAFTIEKLDLKWIFPTAQQWQKALAGQISSKKPTDLTITSSLQGMVYELDPSSNPNHTEICDSETLSLTFRLMLYCIKLASKSEIAEHLNGELLTVLQSYLPVGLGLLNEKLTIENANDLWQQSSPELLQEAAELLSSGNKFIQQWVEDDSFVNYWVPLAHNFIDRKAGTYCTAIAWSYILAQIVDHHGLSNLIQTYEDELKGIHRSTNILKSAAILSVLGPYMSTSTVGKRVSNELVAKCCEPEHSLEFFILFNITLQGQADAVKTIPQHRLLLLLRNLVDVLSNSTIPGVQSECLKLISTILPLVDSIYGDHWERLIDFLVETWNHDLNLPLLNSSLRLSSALHLAALGEEVNQDLLDALETRKHEIDDGLTSCLFFLATSDAGINQPRDITARLLAKQMKSVSAKEDNDLYKLLSSTTEAVQTTAFEILRRMIPQKQEQLSIDLVLDKSIVRLPEALKSQLEFNSVNIRQYLLSWNLVFIHFPHASFLLRESYSDDVKESKKLGDLLDFCCEILRISSGRPIDATSFDFQNFEVNENISPEKEMQVLCVNNYYNALLYLPSLAKEWFISQKNRIKTPLETWTQKHISPSLAAVSLLAVSGWAAVQSGDEKPLEVKTSPKSAELTASIEIDLENPPIALTITLPASYPLEAPVVTSRTRVGVSEKNWQSWLRTIQIIIFSTGSIIDGLIAFRRNVQGALAGQSECAICYSIIGADKQTPNKKCGTCKNTFHGSCLFRWFKSSNSSSCPLCRNNFNYT